MLEKIDKFISIFFSDKVNALVARDDEKAAKVPRRDDQAATNERDGSNRRAVRRAWQWLRPKPRKISQ